MNLIDCKALIVVGSRSDQTCSIGAFARKEALFLRDIFKSVEILEPKSGGFDFENTQIIPDYIFFHAPAVLDRGKPFSALKTLFALKKKYENAKIINIVHEFSEAPFHWKARQAIIAYFSDLVICNTKSDSEYLEPWSEKLLYTNLGPTLANDELFNILDNENEKILNLSKIILSYKKKLSEKFNLSDKKTWILYSGLFTPGKGIENLLKLNLENKMNFEWILIGDTGPKEKDKQYFEEICKSFEQSNISLKVLRALPDEDFKNFLTAADLVLLPFENGVSERRSSFLSAMSCAANVKTTLGIYSKELQLDDVSHVIFKNSELIHSNKSSYEERIKNLFWAQKRSWKKRIADIRLSLTELK